MTDALDSAIQSLLKIKEGNKEFALTFDGDEWRAEIGNLSESVSLGEVAGEFSAIAATPLQAVLDLCRLFQTYRGPQ